MLRSSFRASRWKGVGASAVLTMALVALAYRFPAVLSIDFGRGIESALGSSGFFDAEGSYRWSRARSEIVFPDPGARDAVRVELVLSGFRPPGNPPPRVLVEVEGKSLTITPSRRIETYTLETSTGGVWSSTTRVRIRSDTFSPGGGDERPLGVRLHGARLFLDGPARPPLRQVLACGGAVALVALGLGAPGAMILGVLLSLGFVFFRFYAALVAPPLALGLLGVTLGARFAPGTARFVEEVFRGFGRGLLEGGRSLRSCFVVPLGAILILATAASYALHPKFELGLGTGLSVPIAHRFAGFDRDVDGVLFREPFPGASIDLRDFGASSPWAISITAAATPPGRGTLAEAGGKALPAEVNSRFARYRFELEAPSLGWRSGHVIRFPGLQEQATLRIAAIEVDRGRSLPSFRALALLLGSAALFVAVFGASGLPRPWAIGLGAAVSALAVAGIAICPLFFIPFLDQVALAAGASFLAAAAARGVLEALAKRALVPEPAGASLAIASVALAFWFLATASPLYSGGHFAYHTSVAEEIWQGKFFLYYLPGPDNMLSHQPQWGNMTVPHPSLYHTVTSPLAVFPREWFYVATKLFLALLLFSVVLVAGVVGAAAGDRRSGIYAAAAAAAFPTGSQLLGLGHLMTIFGAFGAALALGFVALLEARLTRRREWLWALALVTFAFLSYTGSLLFGSVALAFASVALVRAEPPLSRSLRLLLLAGWTLALLLYYVHWVAPFFRETLPRMASGAGSDRGIDLPARLALVPEKLTYTFGSWWVPLVGLLGLTRAEGRPRRMLLYGWAIVLPLFSGLDLAFNFLLKHHYFSFPAIAVGIGLALRRLEEKGALGMAVLLLVFVSIWVMGLLELWRVATGPL